MVESQIQLICILYQVQVQIELSRFCYSQPTNNHGWMFIFHQEASMLNSTAVLLVKVEESELQQWNVCLPSSRLSVS